MQTFETPGDHLGLHRPQPHRGATEERMTRPIRRWGPLVEHSLAMPSQRQQAKARLRRHTNNGIRSEIAPSASFLASSDSLVGREYRGRPNRRILSCETEDRHAIRARHATVIIIVEG